MELANNIIFTYGTLKAGFPNHSLLENCGAQLLYHAWTQHKYPLIIHGKWSTPFLLDIQDHTGSYQIEGEVYRVDKEGLATLDLFEGVDRDYYQRKTITVMTKEGKRPITAWCYFKSNGLNEYASKNLNFLSCFGEKESALYIPVKERPFNWKDS